MQSLSRAYNSSPIAQLIINCIPYAGSALDAYLKAKARSSTANSRALQKILGFRYGELWAICSELNKGSVNLHPEPDETNYLGSYGDIYAFFELSLSLPRILPYMNIRFASGWEFANMPGANFRTDMMLLGGPDFNEVTATYMPYTPFEYREEHKQAILYNKITGQSLIYQAGTQASSFRGVDYGFFLKMPNPDNPQKSIFMFNGIRSQGVYGAVKCFLSQALDERNVAESNINKIIQVISRFPYFAITLKVIFTKFSTCIPEVKLDYLLIYEKKMWRIPKKHNIPLLQLDEASQNEVKSISASMNETEENRNDFEKL